MNAPFSVRDVLALKVSARRASKMLKLLANEQRLLIMCRLLEGECSVSELSDTIGLAQSATSQHLARLREEGVLDTRRDAQTIYYRISDNDALAILQTLCALYKPKPKPSALAA